MDWQPIESAPRDENASFLGWDTRNGYYECRFDYQDSGRIQWADNDWQRKTPTHWMPLPPPPDAGERR